MTMGQSSITRRYRFCAAHRLHTEHLSSEENWTAFGKCNNPNGHGHNYVVLVTVEDSDSGGEADDAMARLDRIVTERVVQRFDHHDLNQDPAFADRTTTGENLVLLIWDLLAAAPLPHRLKNVGLIETRDNYFEYDGSGPLQSKGRAHG
jgi:6-pyruvoyltetrahydropterin/6-carboxytetrahydropterin synthase